MRDVVQHLVGKQAAGGGLVLKAKVPLRLRVGMSVAPNRTPHRRTHDLRMFAWIGDEKHPYASDQEIAEVARMGHTLFQMHRLGTPGQPRPPAGELERVIRRVHEAGMLFLWTANADLMYDSAPGVQEMKAGGKWPLWQGFNYGGRYTDQMDRYCDLAATCLASPNGLAEYRLKCDAEMMDRYQVDGMYIDDNLAQHYFGLYESTPFYFADSGSLFATGTPLTYATVYRNDVWNDLMAVVANMKDQAQETSLAIRDADRLGLSPDGSYAVLDVNEGKLREVEASRLGYEKLGGLQLPGGGLKLVYLRKLPEDGPCHLWGGRFRRHARYDRHKPGKGLFLRPFRTWRDSHVLYTSSKRQR
ncbi:MAG: hypothetical protein ACYC6Y_28950 [Thermoguttaceae bacterium]